LHHYNIKIIFCGYSKSLPVEIVKNGRRPAECQKNDKKSWVDVGRSFERIALTLTTLEVENAHLNQPCEVPELKTQLQQHLAPGSVHPQLLLRIGYAKPLPRSPRRPYQQVLI